MNIFFIILIICIAHLYINLYLKPKKDFEILQSNLQNFKEDMLYEKLPFVIFDDIVNANDILNSIFKYQFSLKKKINYGKTEPIIKNKSKYVVIHNNDHNDLIVYLNLPLIRNDSEKKYKNNFYDIITFDNDANLFTESMVSVILKPFNIICIPCFWCFQMNISNNNIPVFFLNDFIHHICINYLNYGI